MTMKIGGPYDDRLLDVLEDIGGSPFQGRVYRMVRDDGRSPLDGSRGAGRFNTREMNVLYCAQVGDGAVAEIYYHISRGQPVFPSKLTYRLYELEVRTTDTLTFLDLNAMEQVGIEAEKYKEMLYGKTQEVAAAAQFMGFDGIIAPSARWDCQNVILFLDAIDPDDIKDIDNEKVDWATWRKLNGK